ncbi:hypothetical protein FA13DRAFT_1766055 [Coprinellus micaceus]|uniref:DUF4246 domain-containing protein n=1 Tax=Coprinellus micaceus TaxID=71717 RepID=A0A4Y7SRV7_COPMI|nr:hypothetical protein FA13DRAFT_1766055 [Coprinellus micaceus]
MCMQRNAPFFPPSGPLPAIPRCVPANDWRSPFRRSCALSPEQCLTCNRGFVKIWVLGDWGNNSAWYTCPNNVTVTSIPPTLFPPPKPGAVVKEPGHGLSLEHLSSLDKYAPRLQQLRNAVLDIGENGEGTRVRSGTAERVSTHLYFRFDPIALRGHDAEVHERCDGQAKLDGEGWFPTITCIYSVSRPRVQGFDEGIVEKWDGEALNDGPAFENQMTERMLSYSTQELCHLARLHPESPIGAIQVLHLDAGVYKSDTAVPLGTKLSSWRTSPSMRKTLVHPSLFPLVYGRTKVLPLGADGTTLKDFIERSGEGQVMPVPDDEIVSRDEWPAFPPLKPGNHDETAFSRKFQWLPCDVDISGTSPKIITDINNLHPQEHQDRYEIIEDVPAAAIPLWDLSLPRAADASHPEQHVFPPEPEGDGDEDWPEFEARADEYWDWVKETRKVVLPEPPENFTQLPVPDKFSLKEMFEKFQVINPEYAGGSWHVEGKVNEAIAATALFYYDSHNIEPSRLAFRQHSRGFGYDDVNYPPDHHDWLPAVYGLRQHGSLMQTIGSVATSEGRLVMFPNAIQHQVQPFKLVDPTKAGYRKILALFLVDSNVNVISTADVPCQRADWCEAWGGGGFPLTMGQAKEYRELLMEGRKRFVLEHQSRIDVEGTISLCEH